MKEIWKDVGGYEGLYQVSNLGRVKSFKGVSERILKLHVDNSGYVHVDLYKNNNHRCPTVHRLVAQAFIPNLENKPEVNHIDEDKTNNMVSNLEWCTRKENCNYGTRNLRTALSKGYKLKAIDIVNGEYNIYCSISECARQLGIDRSNITKQLKGEYRQIGGYIFEYAK